MTVKFTLNNAKVPDGTLLLFGIRYTGQDPDGVARTTEEEAKVYTYAMIKSGGLWYVTGGGRTPQAAGWGAVTRWLERDGREVVSVDLVTDKRRVWPVPSSPEAGQPARVG
jgi:hypothetical protein